jgi:lysozyme
MTNWPGDTAVFPFCISLLKQFEGFRTAPYLDSVGVPTIGYGTIQYPGGEAVKLSDPAILEYQAIQFLTYQLSLKSKAIAPMLQRPATLHQAAAMLSLTYNIGTGGFATSSVLRKFNAGDPAGAADGFLMWDRGTVDGKLVVIAGLLKRRQAERKFFLTHD